MLIASAASLPGEQDPGGGKSAGVDAAALSSTNHMLQKTVLQWESLIS